MLLSQLKYFQVVAQHEHISRAAEELHVAQPALSATISKIEKELGVPLFDRQGRNIGLNDAGRRLLAHADFMFEQIEEMERDLAQTKETLENEFTLSVSNSVFLTGWLWKFVRDNPTVRLRQRMLSEEQMVDALLDESVDVALGEFEEDVPGIVRKVLVEDEYIVTMSPDHPLAQKDILYFDDIRDAEIVALPSNTIFKMADHIFDQKDCTPNIVLEGGPRLITKMVQLNRGILFATRQLLYVPYLMGKNKKLDDQRTPYTTVMQSIADVDCRCTLSICWKEDRVLPEMAQQFIAALEKGYPKYTADKEYVQTKEIKLRAD